MKAKEYLQQLQRLDTIINQKIKELGALRLQAQNTGSMDYSKDPVQSSLSGDAPFVKPVLRMIELEHQINEELNRFICKKHDIINRIQALRNTKSIDVLYKRYVEFKRLDVVAVEMNFTYQYIVELHGYALKEFETTYENLLKTNG